MPCQSSKHRGNKTNPAQQRINQAVSEATLSRLLQMNFSDGAFQIVLTYEAGGYIPVGAYAAQDIKDWILASRRFLGGTFQYVRTMEQGRDGKPVTVHRVITSCREWEAKAIAAKWKYGPAKVEPIETGQLPILAGLLKGNVKAEAGCHSWKASKGLIRS